MSGTIYLDKSDVVTMNGNEFAKKMAVVLTDKLKTELMTCYDVVATGRYPYTGRFGVLSDEDKKAVDEAMELVNVSQIKDKNFTKISDGQRQRVMLSRAICQQPEIIVLDEPTSYLDIKYKLEFYQYSKGLKDRRILRLSCRSMSLIWQSVCQTIFVYRWQICGQIRNSRGGIY